MKENNKSVRKSEAIALHELKGGNPDDSLSFDEDSDRILLNDVPMKDAPE